MPKTVATVLAPEDARDNPARYARADKFLYRLADASGGELYLAKPGSDFKEVFARIADQLRLQYTLCYYSLNQNRDDMLRRIRVEVDRPDQDPCPYHLSGRQVIMRLIQATC